MYCSYESWRLLNPWISNSDLGLKTLLNIGYRAALSLEHRINEVECDMFS